MTTENKTHIIQKLVLTLGLLIALTVAVKTKTKLDTAERYIAELLKRPPIGLVQTQQEYLNGLDNDRYDCGEADGEAGSKFCRALNNWSFDQYAAALVDRMASNGR